HNQISLCWLAKERLGDCCGRPQIVRKRISDVGQRESRTAGDDKRAFPQQRLWLVPFGNVLEGVNSHQKEQAVNFFEALLEFANSVNREVRSAVLARFLRAIHAWSFQQRGYKCLLVLRSQRDHGIAVKIRRQGLRS